MKRVLITRPAGRGQALLEALQQAGFMGFHYPVMVIKPIAETGPRYQQAKSIALDLDSYHKLVFISVNAVQHGLALLENYWPQWPVQQAYYAIGSATAHALSEFGLAPADSGKTAMNSEELLTLPALQDVEGQKILIVRGVGGREWLAEQLRSRGANVDYLCCYQRSLPAKAKGEFAEYINQHHIDMICANSGESLLNACQLYGEPLGGLLGLPVVVPSERVAAIARQQGFSQIVCADNAGIHATIKALQYINN